MYDIPILLKMKKDLLIDEIPITLELFRFLDPIYVYIHVNYAAIFLMFFMLWISYLVFSEADKYKNLSTEQSFFAHKDTQLNHTIVNSIKTNVGDYRPPWWYNSHIGMCSHSITMPSKQFRYYYYY